MKKKIAIVASKARSLRNFRGNLILELVKLGYEVTVFSPDIDETTSKWLSINSIGSVEYTVRRDGLNVFREIACVFGFFRKMHIVSPDIVMAYTVKPVLWTGLFKLLMKRKFRFVPLITGLGYSFSGNSSSRLLLQKLVVRLYRIALKRSDLVVFQNSSNRDYFIGLGITCDRKCKVVSGSGVDINYFKYDPLETTSGKKIEFLMVARLLGEKGVREYVNAAREICSEYYNCSFSLLGAYDSSKDAISRDEIDGWVSEGFLKYLGATDDVRPFLKECHVIVLPSYHEGLPRSVVEGMSIGRMVITTDVPGCKETVVENCNGFLVESGSAKSLVKVFKKVLNDTEIVGIYGRSSRGLVESRFDVNIVNCYMIQYMVGECSEN